MSRRLESSSRRFAEFVSAVFEFVSALAKGGSTTEAGAAAVIGAPTAHCGGVAEPIVGEAAPPAPAGCPDEFVSAV